MKGVGFTGVGFRVYGAGCRVKGVGCRVEGLGVRGGAVCRL